MAKNAFQWIANDQCGLSIIVGLLSPESAYRYVSFSSSRKGSMLCIESVCLTECIVFQIFYTFILHSDIHYARHAKASYSGRANIGSAIADSAESYPIIERSPSDQHWPCLLIFSLRTDKCLQIRARLNDKQHRSYPAIYPHYFLWITRTYDLWWSSCSLGLRSTRLSHEIIVLETAENSLEDTWDQWPNTIRKSSGI